MSKIDPKDKKWIITFKPKNERQNQIDDKFEIFRQIVGLHDTRDVLDLLQYTGNRINEPIQKTLETVTDINTYHNPLIMARLTDDQVARLRKNPNILYVEPDGVARPAAETPSWGNAKHTAPGAWSGGFRGAGVNVAVVDTGSDATHVDLTRNTKVNQNFTTDPNANATDDPHFHGVHVAGIIGAQEGNGVGVAGIAPDCNLWNLKVQATGAGMLFTDIAEALEYAVANGAHIINMSFEADEANQAMASACANAYNNKNMLLFAAMGNSSVRKPAVYPADNPGVNGVTSLDMNDQLSTFTNWGPGSDFCGAGTDILSTKPGNTYQTLSGTSMACPAVSAVAALGYSAYNGSSACTPGNPTASKNRVVEKAMYDSAKQFQGSVGTKNEFYGYGFARATELCAKLRNVPAIAAMI
jgi:subtilisin